MWDKEYNDIFYGDPHERERRAEAKAALKPAVKGQQGSLSIKKVESVAITDLSQLGAVTAPEPPQGAISIMPDDEGNLSVKNVD